jgi:molybdopterin-binding protein
MEQSIRNEIPGTVKEITSDKVLSEIIVETAVGDVAAIITTRSVNDMGLKVGDKVAALTSENLWGLTLSGQAKREAPAQAELLPSPAVAARPFTRQLAAIGYEGLPISAQ